MANGYENLARASRSSREELDKYQGTGEQIRNLASSGLDVPDYYIDQARGERNARSQFLADEVNRTAALAADPSAGEDWQLAAGETLDPGAMQSTLPESSAAPQAASVPLSAGPEDAGILPSAQPPGEGRPGPGMGVPGPEEFFNQQAEIFRQQATLVSASQAQIRTQAEQMAKQMSYIDALNQGGEQAAMEDLARSRQAYERAQSDLDAIRINPNQWVEATPTLSKVLMAVATGVASFATGGRGPNPVVEMIERAIDRDVDAQMTKANMVVKRANIGIDSANTMARLGATLRAATYQRALGALDAITRHGQTEQAIINANMAKNEVAIRALRAGVDQMLTYKQLQLAEQQAAQSGAPIIKDKWDDAKVAEQASASVQGINSLDKMWDLYSKSSEGKVSRMAGSFFGGPYSPFTTDEGVYNEQKGSMGILMAKAAAGFQVSEADRLAFERKLPGMKDNRQAAAKKMAWLMTESIKKLKSTYEQASPSDKARMAPQIQEALQTGRQFIAKTPQIFAAADEDTKRYLIQTFGKK